MADVLVALLLLAVSLAGACATLIQAMRVTHGALLTTRAIDLAADVTEELRGVTSIAQARSVVDAWRGQVGRVLPVAGLRPEQFAALVVLPQDGSHAREAAPRYELILRWHDPPAAGLHELRLITGMPHVPPDARL